MSAEHPPVSLTKHARSFVALGLGNYGAILVAMVINAALTRRLGVEQFGRLALLLTTSQVIALLASNWTQSALVRFGALELAAKSTLAQSFWTRLWIVAPWAVAPVFVALVAGDRAAAYLGIPAWGLFIVWLHFIASLGLSTLGGLFQAKQEMSRYGALLFLDKAVMAVVVLLAPAAFITNPLTVVALYATSSSIVAAGGLAMLGVGSLTPVVFSRQVYDEMWRFSAPLMLSTWSSLFGTNWFDLIVLKWYRPAAELGWYSLGVLLAGVLQQVAVISATIVLPQFSVMVASGEFERIRLVVNRVLPYWLLGTSVLFSTAIVLSGLAVPLVFGSAFERSATVLAVLMIAASALALFSIFAALVNAVGSTWVLTGICLLSGAVNVAGDLAFIPSNGILGAAIATVLAYATSAILVLVFISRRLQMKVMMLTTLSLPVMMTCALFFLVSGPRFYILAVIVGSVMTYALIRRFGLFRSEDTMFFRSLNLLTMWGAR